MSNVRKYFMKNSKLQGHLKKKKKEDFFQNLMLTWEHLLKDGLCSFCLLLM